MKRKKFLWMNIRHRLRLKDKGNVDALLCFLHGTKEKENKGLEQNM